MNASLRFNAAKGLAPLRPEPGDPWWVKKAWFQYRERVGPFAANDWDVSKVENMAGFNTAKGWPLCGPKIFSRSGTDG